MNKLSPSLLAADFAYLGDALKKIEAAGAHFAHLDVMDGMFVPNITIGPPVIKSLRHVSGIIFDVHLMIDRPERYVEAFAKAGADIICFHLEATEFPNSVINQIHGLGKKAAMAIKPGTPAEDLLPFLKNLDMVLIMSVEPGFGGQVFILDSLEKARIIRRHIKKNHYKCDIQMDGGIGISNLKRVIDSGVNVIVAGSDIFGAENVQERIHEYSKIMGTI